MYRFQVESRYYGDGEDAYAMKRDLTTFLKSCEDQEKKLEQEFAKLTLGKEDAAIVDDNAESYKNETEHTEASSDKKKDEETADCNDIKMDAEMKTQVEDEKDDSLKTEEVNKVDDID